MISALYKKYLIFLLLVLAQNSANGMSGQKKELQQKLVSLKGNLTEFKGKLSVLQEKLMTLHASIGQTHTETKGIPTPPPPPPMPKVGDKPGKSPHGGAGVKPKVPEKKVDLMKQIRGEGDAGIPKLKHVSKRKENEAPAGLRDFFKQRADAARESLTLADDDFNSRITDVSKLSNLYGTVSELVVLIESADSQERLKKFIDAFIKIVKKENFFKLEEEFGEDREELDLRAYLISENLDEIIEFIKPIVEFFPDNKNDLLAGIKILEKYKIDYSGNIEKGRESAELQRKAKEQLKQKKAEEQHIIEVEKERIQKALEPARKLIVPPQVQAIGKDGKPIISTAGQPMYIEDPQFNDFTKKSVCGVALSGAFEEIKELIKKAATIQDVYTINEKIGEAKDIFEVQKKLKPEVKSSISKFFTAWEQAYTEASVTPTATEKKVEEAAAPALIPGKKKAPTPPARPKPQHVKTGREQEAAVKSKSEADAADAVLLEKIDALIAKIDQTPKPKKEPKLKSNTLEKEIFEIFRKIKMGQIFDDSVLLKNWIENPKIDEAINNLAGHEKTLAKFRVSLEALKTKIQPPASKKPPAAAASGQVPPFGPAAKSKHEEETELSQTTKKVLKIMTPEEKAGKLKGWSSANDVLPISTTKEELPEILNLLSPTELGKLKNFVQQRLGLKLKSKQASEEEKLLLQFINDYKLPVKKK